MAEIDCVTRREFDAAHKAVQDDLARLDRQMNGNGQPGVLQMLGDVHGYVRRKEGEEAGIAKAAQEAKALAIERERKAESGRALVRWVAGGVMTVVIGVTGWGAIHIWNWIEPPAAAIIREYYDRHPDAKDAKAPDKKGYFNDAPPVVQSQPEKHDATSAPY